MGIDQTNFDPTWRKSMIAGLLSGQRADGGFGVHPYSKWTGSHWRVISLVELGIPAGNRAARAAANDVLSWIAGPSNPVVIAGRERRHASMEGNALAVSCRLGMARDRRVRHLVEVLLRAQWPDGGWNCDRDADANHSSFHESLAPIWGLVEYNRSTDDADALTAAQRAGELLLQHRLFRSSATGRVIDPEWQRIHWPHYWHYDYFQGLRAVELLGRIADPRCSDALALLHQRRRPDGTWRVGGRRYWRRPGSTQSNVEAVDWGNAQQVVTAAALAVLQ